MYRVIPYFFTILGINILLWGLFLGFFPLTLQFGFLLLFFMLWAFLAGAGLHQYDNKNLNA